MRRVWLAKSAGDIVGVLAAMNEDAVAIAEGRVFLGRRRVNANQAVRAGDEVFVATRKEEKVAEMLGERDGVVATNKPAGVPTVPDQGGASHSHVANVARALGLSIAALHITSRLDREVSGVVLFATSDAAAQRLREARAGGRYDRRYVALAVGAIEDARWTAPIGRGRDARHRAAGGPEAKPAETAMHVVARADRLSLLALAPRTGRTHQIRVHASHAGAPLLGDRAYGGPDRLVAANGRVVGLARIALHCARVTVDGFTAIAAVPPELRKPWTELGGDAAAWDTAVACDVDGDSSP